MNRALRVTLRTWRRLTRPLRDAARAARRLRIVPDRVDAIGIRLNDLQFQLESHQRETRLLHRAIQKPAWSFDTEHVALAAPTATAEVSARSILCRQQDFAQPWFNYWTYRIGSVPRYHRKLWEFVFICQGLFERGVLTTGSRGLGFGVGGEPLPALFASYDCEIVATDLSPEMGAAIGWIETSQHARERDGLRRPTICPDDLFDRNVSFRPCDMNDISADLTGFDFCWSSCAFEHLGSIELGLAFVENSIKCLKPGGWAIHTSEFNLLSNEDTIDNAGTVLFRRRDYEELAQRLTRNGHRMAPLYFKSGEGLLDHYIDVAPFSEDTSLKLAMFGFATTSFAVVVQRGPDPIEAVGGQPEIAEATEALTLLKSAEINERRHGAFMIGRWLVADGHHSDEAVRRFHQALIDAIVQEWEPGLVGFNLQILQQSERPLVNLEGWDALADGIPTMTVANAEIANRLLHRAGHEWRLRPTPSASA